MKRILMIMTVALVTMTASAQPKARRNAAASNKTQAAQQMTQRARLMYPTALDMPQDVVWRRDIYRELDLNIDANAGLYYPVEPIDKQLNLFTYVFKLALNGYIPVYEYRLDGNEVFYEEKNGKIRVDNSDIPSAEVKMYYLKESAYYDQANATFRRKVISLCPVMMRDDDFGGEASKYPLFWVKYSDLEPFLNKQTVMTSNLNNAAVMTLDDYFTMNRYEGKIYKTTNMLGRTLAQYCQNDSALKKEQMKIEGELKAFEQNIFGDQAKKDSLDSIANLDPKAAREAQKAAKKANRRNGQNSAKVDKPRKPKNQSGGGTSAARVTVRRQRH